MSRFVAHGMALVLGLLLSPAPAPAEQYAVLIGVQEHDNPQWNLRYAESDVLELRQVLVERGLFKPEHILQLTDGAQVDRVPTSTNISTQVPAFLGRIPKGSKLIVFFSGHGTLHEGQTLLVPRDFTLDEPQKRGLPLAKLRQWIVNCNAESRYLFLDSCHAGNPAQPATSGVLAKQVGDIERCVVLASCDQDEESLEWPARRRSVFTYWLCRALEGAAANQGEVRIEDIRKYTRNRVKETAELLGGKQSPIQFGTLRDEHVVLRLAPETPETLCRRLAAHLDLEIRRKLVKAGVKPAVGVWDFCELAGQGTRLPQSIQPRYCMEQVEKELRSLAGDAYLVRTASEVRAASAQATLETVRDPDQLRKMKSDGKLNAIIVGELRRSGNNVRASVEMLDTNSGDELGKSEGVFAQSEGGRADGGGSFSHVVTKPNAMVGGIVPTQNTRPEGEPTDGPVLDRVADLLTKPHPLLNPDSIPFRIGIRTQGERTAKPFYPVPGQPNSVVIPARKGERFVIDVTNLGLTDVGMVLLADGINTLGGVRERVETAKLWVLPPKDPRTVTGWTVNKSSSEDIPGLKDATLRNVPDDTYIVTPFQFADASESLAARQGYTTGIGVITVAFFAPKTGGKDRSGNLGIDGVSGQKYEVKLERRPFQAGELLAAFNIQYADEATVKKAK